jgi:predicted phage terminase large subunit-like protein
MNQTATKEYLPTLDSIDALLAKNNLLDFTKFTMPDYEVNWHHRLLCDEITNFIDDHNRKRLMVFLPPRRGKSQLISRHLPAYYLGKYPDNSIIASSYAADLASRMNRDVQRIIDTERYREVFPDTKLSSKNIKVVAKGNYIRTSDLFEIVNHKGAYRSSGVGGGLTGMGSNLGIIDDVLKDMKEAMSSTVRQSILDWYDSVFYTRLAKGGKIIIVMTRWHPDDLCGSLLKRAARNPKADQWEVISIPEMFEPEKAHPLDPRTVQGEVLWPDWFPKDEVIKVKETVGSKVWSSLYQQNPVDEGGSIIKRDDFKYYQELPEFDYIVHSWDFTFKDAAKSDYVVGGAIGVKGSNKYVLPRLVRDRMNFTAMLNAMKHYTVAASEEYGPYREIIIEAKANGEAIINSVKDVFDAIYPYSPTEGKMTRAASVSPQIEAGNVYLPDPLVFREAQKWVSGFVEEWASAPSCVHDDQIDFLTQALIRIKNVPKWLGITDEDIEEFLHEEQELGALSKIFGRRLG